jgi:hypothetical protein
MAAVSEGMPEAESPTIHVVQPDDTLDSIAEQYGLDAQVLYQLNTTTLEGEATCRGLAGGSEGGRILFPGTTLKLVK